MKNIILLGASGSIGQQTIDILRQHKDRFKLVAFSVGKRVEVAYDIIKEFPVDSVCVSTYKDAQKLKEDFPNLHVFHGDEGLIKIATHRDGDTVINALVGFVGLIPTLEAIKSFKDIALANKETLVVGGEFVKELLGKYPVTLLPIDSEHSAILQALQGNSLKEVKKIIITASGGSFRDKTREQLVNVSVDEALAHPNWAMGAKITIDSATMMNKGLEVIEAHYLFDLPYDKIDVIMHRQSIVHSLVEYQDTSMMAQLGTSDMRLPIQYALSYPNRFELQADSLDLKTLSTLTFEELSFERFPLIALAYEVGRKKGNLPAIMNGANEAAVAAFLNKQISFLEIETLVIEACKSVEYICNPTLEQVLEADTLAREFVLSQLEK